MKPNEIICSACDGNGYCGDEICKLCHGSGVMTRKRLTEITETEQELPKHSLTVDEWVLEQQRKRGLIK
jgi:DnaJ-class molecular chaperone